MNGLSEMGMGQGQQAMMQEQMPEQEQAGMTVEDVMGALMQGMSPEELVKQGVPMELVKQAIAMLQEQMQQGQGQMQSQQGGLSAMGMQ